MVVDLNIQIATFVEIRNITENASAYEFFFLPQILKLDFWFGFFIDIPTFSLPRMNETKKTFRIK